LNLFSKDRYAFDFARPIIDNTTNDWFVLQGQESNGWTAIQFKRLIDTCDSMDYPIKVLFHFRNHFLLLIIFNRVEQMY
jgi:hypothetical protein